MPTHPFWKLFSPARANEILCCAQETNKKLYRSTVDIMAPSIGLRPVKVLEMPKVERHAAFARYLSEPALEALSFNLITVWFIQKHKPLLCTWLDSLGIEHDEDGCTNIFPPSSPPKETLQKAVDLLLSKFDPELVALYLNAFNEIDVVHWQPLAEILASNKKLQLTA